MSTVSISFAQTWAWPDMKSAGCLDLPWFTRKTIFVVFGVFLDSLELKTQVSWCTECTFRAKRQLKPQWCKQSIDHCRSLVIAFKVAAAPWRQLFTSLWFQNQTPLNDKSCFYMCLREKEKIAFLHRLMAHLQRGRHFITLTCGLLQEDEDAHSRRWRQIDHRWSFSTQMRAHLPSIF